MSMGFKACMCCSGEAEGLYAVDGMIEYYCPECQTRWAEEPLELYHNSFEAWLYNNYGED